MGIFKEKQLYRVQIIEECPVMGIIELTAGRMYLPDIKDLEKGKFGFIPKGIEGWVIEKLGKKYFVADEGQEGLSLFISGSKEASTTLINFNKVEKYSKKI